jgi:Cu(I)/Ag(I) efflux system membrane protein CusA/SilA
MTRLPMTAKNIIKGLLPPFVVDAVRRVRPKLMTVTAVLASLVPILWESGIGSDVMKPIAAPIVGGMITSTIHVLILVPVFFELIQKRALRRGALIHV